jgi:hypothetical protein
MSIDPDAPRVPVTRARIATCLDSAQFWAHELPRYADRQQRRADAWSIAAGILAALTSLSIFPVLTANAADWEKWVVSAVAMLAAICALVPRVRSYGELAGQAREVSSRYGRLTGELMDLARAEYLDQDRARYVVTEFQATKEKKDALRGLPERAKVEIEFAEVSGRAAEAKRKATEAARVEIIARRELELTKMSRGQAETRGRDRSGGEVELAEILE